MSTEIAPGVFVFDHAVAEGKNAIVAGDAAAWAIDTGTHPAEGQELADALRRLDRPGRRLIYTHGHADHVLGSAAFRGADVVAHGRMPALTLELLPAWSARFGVSVEEVRGQIAWPTLTFDGELRLDLGGRHLRLFPAPGHSADGIAIYVEEARLLVAGDTVVTCIPPAIGHGDSRALEATLRNLVRLEIETLVPGHGPVVFGRAAVAETLAWQTGYLAATRAAVRAALAQDVPPEAVPERVPYDALIGDRFDRDRHKMPTRHRDIVAVIAREETEGAGRQAA
jgi:glyoxylase-like metal-dependent hydrolase (beta-lactamase superfamily II)